MDGLNWQNEEKRKKKKRKSKKTKKAKRKKEEKKRGNQTTKKTKERGKARKQTKRKKKKEESGETWQENMAKNSLAFRTCAGLRISTSWPFKTVAAAQTQRKKRQTKPKKRDTQNKVGREKKDNKGPDRDLNPGPLAPKASIIPLDHRAMSGKWVMSSLFKHTLRQLASAEKKGKKSELGLTGI